MKEQNNIQWISPENEKLTYMGRIDFSRPERPFFIYPASNVRFSFTGTSLYVKIDEKRQYWENSLGYILDGQQKRIDLYEEEGEMVLTLAEGLAKGTHEVIFFKRMDACHAFYLLGFGVDEEATIEEIKLANKRQMVFYGDSVTAGEVSEAVEFVGQADPEHKGEFSNSWYSYAKMTADRCASSYHLIAQGGIALIDGIGWYDAPEYKGMLSVYDKINYQPAYGPIHQWDFKKDKDANVVVVAIGQNDNHPVDFMKEDYEGQEAKSWRESYAGFLDTLRALYPKAWIVTITTLLEHDPSWDKAIDEVVKKSEDKYLRHYMFNRNGAGTKGHLRIPEAEEMAIELSGFINRLEGVFEA